MARRWTLEEENQKRKELIDLYIAENKTIKEVGLVLGVAESTVFDRLQRLGVPSLPCKKVNFLNKKKGLKFPGFSSELAEFFGIMLGDGHLSDSQIWIAINNNTDKEYRPYVEVLLKKLFAVSPGVCYREKEDMKNLFLSSVDLIKYLKTKGLYAKNKVKSQVDLPSWILEKDCYKKSFLRGFFDTDGSVYSLKYGVQMSFCNRSFPLLKSTRKILIDFGYSPSKISQYKVYLTRKSDLYKYVKEIGFGNPKHLKRSKMFKII